MFLWMLKLLKLLKLWLWLGLGWGEGKTLLKHVKRRDQCYSIRIGRTWSKRPRKSGRYIRGVEVGDILISWPLRRQGRRRPLLQFRWHEPSGCRRLCIDVVIPSRVFIRVGLPAVGHITVLFLSWVDCRCRLTFEARDFPRFSVSQQNHSISEIHEIRENLSHFQWSTKACTALEYTNSSQWRNLFLDFPHTSILYSIKALVALPT